MNYVILALVLLLTACARSPETRYYVLSPLPVISTKPVQYQGLRIGINEINVPEYLEKPQLAIHVSKNQLDLLENDQWADPLDKSIGRILAANLMTLLPGSVVAVKPWDDPFKPAYLLQINIIDLRLDNQGRANLVVDYMIYREERLIRKERLRYTRVMHPCALANLVQETNENLNQLSATLAARFRRL